VRYWNNRTPIAALALASAFGVASAQRSPEKPDLLARRLADANLETRSAAIEEVIASPGNWTTVLLDWTTNPPAGVRASDLNVGLAEAFGRIKTEAAVPFLIRVISIRRFPFTLAPWIKEASSVEYEYPAAEALVRIGPAAAEAVIKAADGPMTPLERLCAIFVVGQAAAAPGTREFLMRAIGQANADRVWAEKGLEALKEKEDKGTGTPK